MTSHVTPVIYFAALSSLILDHMVFSWHFSHRKAQIHGLGADPPKPARVEEGPRVLLLGPATPTSALHRCSFEDREGVGPDAVDPEEVGTWVGAEGGRRYPHPDPRS